MNRRIVLGSPVAAEANRFPLVAKGARTKINHACRHVDVAWSGSLFD